MHNPSLAGDDSISGITLHLLVMIPFTCCVMIFVHNHHLLVVVILFVHDPSW